MGRWGLGVRGSDTHLLRTSCFAGSSIACSQVLDRALVLGRGDGRKKGLQEVASVRASHVPDQPPDSLWYTPTHAQMTLGHAQADLLVTCVEK